MAAKANPSVYAIVNSKTGRRYIGGATYPQQRWFEHKSTLRAGIHRNKFLQADWNSFGESGFVFEIIEVADSESLKERELHYIKIGNKEYASGKLPPLYNIFNGTEKSCWSKELLSEKEKEGNRLEANRKAYKKRRFTERKRAEQNGFNSWAEMIAALYDGKVRTISAGA